MGSKLFFSLSCMDMDRPFYSFLSCFSHLHLVIVGFSWLPGFFPTLKIYHSVSSHYFFREFTNMSFWLIIYKIIYMLIYYLFLQSGRYILCDGISNNSQMVMYMTMCKFCQLLKPLLWEGWDRSKGTETLGVMPS